MGTIPILPRHFKDPYVKTVPQVPQKRNEFVSLIISPGIFSDVVDKNKTFEDETSNMEEYWKGKISEKCMSSSDLTDTGENLPNLTSQVTN